LKDRKAYFQYYETFEKIVQKFRTAEERDSFRSKIINYGLFGDEPKELNDREEIVWEIVKDMIDDQVHRREVNKANRAEREAKKKEKKPEEPEQIKEEAPAEKKPKAQKFVPPTVEEVQEYCNERNNGINAEQFVAYYEARGWKTKSGPIKNWKACVVTWESRENSTGYNPSPQIMEWPADKLML